MIDNRLLALATSGIFVFTLTVSLWGDVPFYPSFMFALFSVIIVLMVATVSELIAFERSSRRRSDKE